MKAAVLNEGSVTVSSSRAEPMDYTSTLCFYSQVGHINANNEISEQPESAMQIILPFEHRKDVCLGYPIGYKPDDAMDIVDGEVWLYRPQKYVPSNIFYLCLSLTILLAVDMVLVMLILFGKEYELHFNVHYNGGSEGNTFVVGYFVVLLISSIGCSVCVWMTYLKFLSVFYSALITDLIFSLLWMEHYIQFLHWTLTAIICYLLAKYLSQSFGKWNFLQSQTRIDELEQLHREGRF